MLQCVAAHMCVNTPSNFRHRHYVAHSQLDRLCVNTPSISQQRHYVAAWAAADALGGEGRGGKKSDGGGWTRGRLKRDAQAQYGLVDVCVCVRVDMYTQRGRARERDGKGSYS